MSLQVTSSQRLTSEIFSNLNRNELVECRAVCKQWKQLAENEVWGRMGLPSQSHHQISWKHVTLPIVINDRQLPNRMQEFRNRLHLGQAARFTCWTTRSPNPITIELNVAGPTTPTQPFLEEHCLAEPRVTCSGFGQMWGTSPEMEELIKTVTVVSSIGAGIKEHRFELEVSQRPIHHFRAVVTLPAQYGSPVAGQTNAIEKVIIYIVSETLLDMAKENAACAQTPAPRVKNQCCVLS